jgi:hypothetical protein
VTLPELFKWGKEKGFSCPLHNEPAVHTASMYKDDDRERIFKGIRNAALFGSGKLSIIHGELRDGPVSTLLGNAMAAQMRLKTRNRKAQTLLCRYAEPFANLIDSPDAEIQHKLLQKAWKYLLKSHSHDAINGVATDKTADDIANRLQRKPECTE